MIVESNIKPDQFTVEPDGRVICRENIVQIEKTDMDTATAIWQWDEYSVHTVWREQLPDQVAANFVKWLDIAKAKALEPIPLTLPQKVDSIETTQDKIVEVLALGLGVAL